MSESQKNYIINGEGVFGISAGGQASEVFGMIISGLNYDWSASTTELNNDLGLTIGQVLFNSQAKITFDAYFKKGANGSTLPHIGEIVPLANFQIYNLGIKNEGETVAEKVPNGIVQSISAKFESGAYASASIELLYNPNIAAIQSTPEA